MNRPGVRQVPDGSREQRKIEETSCEVVSGAQTTLVFKGSTKEGKGRTQWAIARSTLPPSSLTQGFVFSSGRKLGLSVQFIRRDPKNCVSPCSGARI